MAGEDLSLLFRVRGDASGAKQATADTRTAVAQLRSQITSDSKAIATAGQVGAKGTQSLALSLQTVQSSLQSIGGPVGAFSGQIVNATSMLSGFSGEAAGLAGPAGLAVVAIGAMTAATVGLAKQIFDLTVQTADWQGKIYDLSQQTDVSVETLGTLEVALRKTGSNLDSATSSLVIFQTQLAEAQDPTTETAKRFRELGITASDTETAFRQALKAVAAMPEGFERVNTAAELFGRRGAKQLLAATNETKGDLDALTKKLRDLGILLSTETAAKADEFNDQLLIVQLQLRAITALVGREAMPTILNALQQASKALVDNRQVISGWATSIGDAGRGALIFGGYLKDLGGIITGLSNIPIPMIIRILGSISGATGILTGLAQIGAANRPPDVGISATLGAGLTPGVGRIPSIGSGAGGGGGAARISEGQRLLNQLTEEYNRLTAKSNELSKVQIVALEILDGKYKGLAPSLRTLIFEEAAKIDTITRATAAEKIRMEALKSVADFIARQNDAIRDAVLNEDEWDKQIRKLTETLTAAGVKIDAATFSIIKQNDTILKMIALNREADTSIGELGSEFDGLHEKLAEFIDSTGSGTAYLEWLREVGQAIKDANIKEHIDALRRAQGERIEAQVGPAPPPMELKGADESRSAIDQLFGAINENLSGATQTAALAGLEALTGAFQGLGQAIGSVVESWVLYGEAGTSVRKVTAQILAGVAAQAAVKAVFELAEGFAALALALFGMPNAGPSAQAHFVAAGIYASIAGIAAVAGRSIAGDSFKKSAEPGGGSGSSRSGGSSDGQPSKPGTTDVNRNAIAQPMGTLTINLGLKDGVIADGFKKDYMLNGVTRLVIKTDGQG